MSGMERDEIVKFLTGRGFRADFANIYANAFIDYRKASEKIAAQGPIVNHPRTGNPMENPYISIRNKAIPVLKEFGNEHSEELWS